jgi:altronate dehydratase
MVDAGFQVDNEIIESLNNELKHPIKIRGMVLGLDCDKGVVHKLETLPLDHKYSDLLVEGSPYFPQKDIR